MTTPCENCGRELELERGKTVICADCRQPNPAPPTAEQPPKPAPKDPAPEKTAPARRR